MRRYLLLALVGVLLLPTLPSAALQLPTELPTGLPTGLPSEMPTGMPSQLPSDPAGPLATPTPSPTDDLTEGRGTGRLTYAGRGLTDALSFTAGGMGLETGVTAARVANAATPDCDSTACAVAAGAAPPVGEEASATAPNSNGPDTVEMFDLGEDGDPELEQIAMATFGSATAETAAQPSAEAAANGATIDITLTQTIVNDLPAEITDGLDDGLGQIAESLTPISDADPTGTLGGVTDILEGLVGDLGSSPLMRIQSAESASTSEFEGGVVSARAQAAGAIITVLPTDDSTPLVPEGLAVIEVTPSVAAAAANGEDPATAQAVGSVARITLLPGVLDALGSGAGGEGPSIDDLPIEDILDLLPLEVTDLLPSQSNGSGGGTDTSTDGQTGSVGLQADADSGGFVIDLTTGSEEMCIAEATPAETCITLGATSQTFTADRLGVGVLAAGVNISALRDESGAGQLEFAVGRSEAGVAAEFASSNTNTPGSTPRPRPSATSQTALPRTGSSATLVLPSLALMMLSGLAISGLRRRQDH